MKIEAATRLKLTAAPSMERKFKATVKDVVTRLKVKAINPESDPEWYSVQVRRPSNVNPEQAEALMKPYGKGKRTTRGPNANSGNILIIYEKDGIELNLIFTSNALTEIECRAN